MDPEARKRNAGSTRCDTNSPVWQMAGNARRAPGSSVGRDPQTLGGRAAVRAGAPPARRAQPCPRRQRDTAKALERRLVQQLDADAACRPLKPRPAHRARRPGLGRGKAPGCRPRAAGCAGRPCWRRVVPTPCSSSEMEKPPPCPRGRPDSSRWSGRFGLAAQTRPLPGGL